MKRHCCIAIMILFLMFMSCAVFAGSPRDYIRVVSSDDKGVVIELWIPNPVIEKLWINKKLFHRVTIPGFGATADVGKPQLPQIGTILGVPDNSEPTIDILETDVAVISKYMVQPALKPIIRENNGIKKIDYEFAMDKKAYSSKNFEPSKVVTIGSTGFMRDQKIAKIIFLPVQFNPSTGEIRYYSRIRARFNYNITDTAVKKTSAAKKSSFGFRADAYEELLKRVLLNYKQMRGSR